MINTTEVQTQKLRISKNDILASLKPLAEEYFSGEIDAANCGLIFTACNGQRFRIYVEEIN